MSKCHVVGNVLTGVCLNGGDVHQEAGGHADQGLGWPGVEPVKGCAVDQGRELASPDAELVAHRAETEDHMQELPHLSQQAMRVVTSKALGDFTGHYASAACKRSQTFCAFRGQHAHKRSKAVQRNVHIIPCQ